LSDGLQVISEGLKPEDWVVVNGIQRVRDGAKVEPKRIPMPGAPSTPPAAAAGEKGTNSPLSPASGERGRGEGAAPTNQSSKN